MKHLFLGLWFLSLSTFSYGSNTTQSDDGSYSPSEGISFELMQLNELRLNDTPTLVLVLNPVPTDDTSPLSSMPEGPQIRHLSKEYERNLSPFMLPPANE